MMRFVWLLAFLLVAIAGGLMYFRAGAVASAETHIVGLGSIARGVRGPGKIEGTREMTIRAPIPGRIDEMKPKEGDEVVEQDYIAEMNPTEINGKIAEAEAVLKQREAEFELAKLGASPEAIKKCEEKVREAGEAVKIAETRLKALKQPQALPAAPASQIEDAQRNIESAKAKLDLANAKRKLLEPAADAISQLELEVAVAKSEMDVANDLLQGYKKPPNSAFGPGVPDMKPEYQARYDIACKKYDVAVAKLVTLKKGPRPEEVAAAEANINLARIELEAAQAAKKRLETPEAPQPAKDADVKEAEAAVAQSKARANQVEADCREMQRPPRPEELAAKQAAVEQAKQQLQQLKDKKEALKVRAPLTGIILKRLVEPGAIVNGMEPIAMICDFSEKKVRAEVDVARVRDIKEGMPVVITSRAFKEELVGKVEKIGNNAATRTLFSEDKTEPSGGQVVQIIIAVEAPKGDLKKEAYNQLRPGLRCDVEVTLEKRENVITVPKTYVSTGEDGREFVYVLERNSKSGANEAPRVRPIKCGLRDDHYVEISEGLTNGDVIVKPRSMAR